MHFKYRPIHLWILSCFTLLSCTREKIVLDQFGTDKGVAILAVVDGTGQFHQFKMSSATQVIGGNSSGSGEPVKNAHVYVVHGSDTMYYPYDSNLDAYAGLPMAGFYQPGQTYQLFAEVPDKTDIRAQCKIIDYYQAETDSLYISKSATDEVNTFHFHVEFSDQAGKANYYRLIPMLMQVNEADSSDTLSFPLNNTSFLFYDDKSAVNGKVILNFNLEQQAFEIPGFKAKGIKLYILNTDELYYTYHKKIIGTSEVDGLENPVFIPGNIKNGYGIFSSINGLSQKTFPLE